VTVLNQYVPAVAAWDGTNREFTFPWECLGLAALEVYYETPTATAGLVTREYVEPQYYTVLFSGQPPTYVGGKVTLTGTVPAGVTEISIERNTKIDQLADYAFAVPFHMDMLEFGADRLTMIIQELAYRKCNIDIAGPIEQTIPLNASRVLYQNTLDSMIDILTAYCLEMDTNGLDCFDNPEGTGNTGDGQ
jgi:hypothetical protein